MSSRNQVNSIVNESTNYYINFLKKIIQKDDEEDQFPYNMNDSYSTCTSVSREGEKVIEKLTIENLFLSQKQYLRTNYPLLYALQEKYSQPKIPIVTKKNSIYMLIKSFNLENIHKAIKYN